MDPVRSAEKSRFKNRSLQNFKSDDLKINSKNNEEKSSLSRLGLIKNSPDLETNLKHWAITSEGFPPGVTVDELKKYGRRRQPNHLRPQDNLRLEEGSIRLYKSEYKHRFLGFGLPKELLSLEEKKASRNGDSFSKHRDSLIKYSLREPVLKPQNNLYIPKDQPMESATEKNSKYLAFSHYEKRKLLRRSTALKPEGIIACETEVQKAYIDHKNPKKTQIIRNLPSLRLEGEFEPLTTEQRDKFIAYLLSQRPVLEKKKTTLTIEGNFDFATENNLSYIRHELSARPRIRKRSTSLKLEGEVEFSPEYSISFVDFPRTRPVTYKPTAKLRHEGQLESLTETKTQFVNYENISIPQSAKPENNLHIEGQMEINPEYKINFVNFPRERPVLRKPFNQLKPEGNLQMLTENSGKDRDDVEVEIAQPNNLQSSNDLALIKELTNISENAGKLNEDEILNKPETAGKNSEPGDGEMNLRVEKSDELGFLASKRGATPSKLEKEYLFLPRIKKFQTENEKEQRAKLTTDVKLNLSTPRKKGQRNKFKTPSEFEKKSSHETSHRKCSIKRLKEAASEMNQTRISKEKLEKFDGAKRGDAYHLKHSLCFSEVFPNDILPVTKEFPAFKVLDVKGQLGCQSLAKDILESEKSTSDEDASTYRLEVINPEDKASGFYRNSRRIFPSSAVDFGKLAKAESQAKQRAANYVKIVKSPEIPNSLLEEGNTEAEGRWRVSDNLRPLQPQENLNKRSFVVLENKGA